MASLGSLVIQMAVDTAKFQGDLGRAATIAETRMRHIKDSVSRTVGQLSAIGLAAGAALTAAMKAGIDRADDMADLAQAVGVTVENLSRLQFVAQESGLSAEELGAGLVKLSKHLKEVGDQRSADQALLAIAEHFSKMPDGVEKTTQALEYFGRAGAKMIPLLNEGAAGIVEMMKQSDELGFTISQNTADAADQFNKKLGILSKGVTAFNTNLAAALLPSLNALASEFLHTKTAGEALDKVVRIAATGLKLLLTAGELTRLVFQQLGEGLGAVAAAVVQAAQGNFRQAWEIMKASSEDGAEQVQASVTRILDIWEEASATSAAMAPKVGDDLAAPILNAAKKAKKAAEDYGSAVNAVGEAFQAQLKFRRDVMGDLGSSSSKALDEISASEERKRDEVAKTASQMSVYAEEAARNMQTTFADFLFDPFSKGLDGMLAGFISTVQRMVAEALSAEILQAFFGALGGIGGGIGSFFSSMAGGIGKATGGPVMKGQSYLVGENGPEMFRPATAGSIVPNGGGGISLSYNIDARGADAERIMAIMPGLLKQSSDQTVARVRDLVGRGKLV
jgi:hypothetical protein